MKQVPSDVDPVTREVHKKKHHIITVLPLQIAAYLNWKLDIFEEK